MTPDDRRQELNQILSNLADCLNIPQSKYEDARSKYEAVGEWLDNEQSEIRHLSPVILPQGSFALGTVIRPVGVEEFDIDLVCHLILEMGATSPSKLKELIGNRLRASEVYRRMLQSITERCCRRCCRTFILPVRLALTSAC